MSIAEQIVILDTGPTNAKASRRLFEALTSEQQLSLTEAVQTEQLVLNPFALAATELVGE